MTFMLPGAVYRHFRPPPTAQPCGCGPHGWITHPTPWRHATGRWAEEISEAHEAHLRMVAGLPVADSDDGPLVQPYVVPT